MPRPPLHPLLRERRFGLTHFHLRDVTAEFDSGGRDRGLKLCGLGFHIRFIFVRPDPDEFVLRPVHPGTDDGTPIFSCNRMTDRSTPSIADYSLQANRSF